jgi:hypothetical protein
MLAVYKNKKRPVSKGSQSESPSVQIHKDRCIVNGYQRYVISPTSIIITHYQAKFNYMRKFLETHIDTCKSFIDIGASNGLVCFMAARAGYQEIYGLDHDLACINTMNKIKAFGKFQTFKAEPYSFGDPHCPADIVFMGALIHWIYSCTALYGDFGKIFKYIRSLCTKYLLIEWVNPNDPAIVSFKHTSFNKSIIKEPYTRVNFIKNLQKFFPSVEKACSVNGTRELFLCTCDETMLSESDE